MVSLARGYREAAGWQPPGRNASRSSLLITVWSRASKSRGTVAKFKDVCTENQLLTVWLIDGRILSMPLTSYPSMSEAMIEERSTWQASGAGRGIHWPSLDYDLSVEGLLAGCQERPLRAGLDPKTRARYKSAPPPPRRTKANPEESREGPRLSAVARRVDSRNRPGAFPPV